MLFIQQLSKVSILKLYALALLILLILVPVLYELYVNILGLQFVPSKRTLLDSSFLRGFYSIIIAPPIETLLFQYVPIKFFETYSFLNKRKVLIISISAILFGVFHNSSLYTMIYAFHMGFVIATFYVITDKNKNAFVHTTILHSVFNMLLFIGRLL